MDRKTCAVVITSYNRCEDLRHTCTQLQRLDPQPNEIIICLDGCTDDSQSMLAREFPRCQVVENEKRQGSIPSRDKAFRLVGSDLIVTLDDDSYPLDAAFIKKLSALVEKHPEAGAFTFPEIRNDGQPIDPNMAPESPGHYVRDFPNCAGVLRRVVYGREAKYPRFFSHMYEEPDYCLQLYAGGYAAWFEPSLQIRHHFTPIERNLLNRHLQNARNELWSVIMRCPFPQVLVIAPLRILRQFVYASSQGWIWCLNEPRWWWNALLGLGDCLAQRKPVTWRDFWQWTRLARHPATSIDELEKRFARSFGGPIARGTCADLAIHGGLQVISGDSAH